jgi:hypothetical protein
MQTSRDISRAEKDRGSPDEGQNYQAEVAEGKEAL